MNKNNMKKWIKIFNSAKDVKNIVNKLPKEKIIVYTYGVWDIMHPGHVKILVRAKELGDFLIVGVVTDEPVRQLKGEYRPVQCLEDRLFNVGALRCVDAVIAQREYDPSPELSEIKRVNILTKGDDWNDIPGTDTIIAMGGKLVKLEYSPGYSTSSLVSKISGKPITKHGEPKC